MVKRTMSKPSRSSPAAAPPNNNNNMKKGDNKSPPFQTRTACRQQYYQPSVYQFTCRGAFHLHTTDAAKLQVHSKSSQRKQQNFNDNAADGVGAALRDAYTCRGFQTKPRIESVVRKPRAVVITKRVVVDLKAGRKLKKKRRRIIQQIITAVRQKILTNNSLNKMKNQKSHTLPTVLLKLASSQYMKFNIT